MKKIFLLSILSIVFVGSALFGGVYLLLSSHKNIATPVVVTADKLFGWKFPVAKFPQTGTSGQFAYSTIRDPGGIPQGLPVRLKIPTIGVDSAIEDALITTDGRMDVPIGSVNVAWFALGPHPGEVGSAVIGGHFGINYGVPYVFYNLDKVKINDKLYIVNDKDETLAFVVRSIKSFNRNDDATSIFTSTDGLAHLNLITCEGVWNQTNGNYPQRLVVFSDAVAAEGAAPESSVFKRTLNIGSTGADVIVLQNILENKGLLIIPKGITKGYFGRLTHNAVAKYQTIAHLLSNGVFDPSTRIKMLAELGDNSNLPDTGTQLVVENSSGSSQIFSPDLAQTFWYSVRSLFETPRDIFITSCLFIAIVFVAFKLSPFSRVLLLRP